MESIAVLSSIIKPGESNAHNSRTLQLPGQIHNVLWMVQQSENWKKNEDEKQSYIKIITFQKNKVTSCVLVDSFLLNIITYQKTKL